MILNKRREHYHFGTKKNNLRSIYLTLFVCVLFLIFGCAYFPNLSPTKTRATSNNPKLFIIILDALTHRTLMQSQDYLPNINYLIHGDNNRNPYVYFENVLVSLPSESMPSNTTLLTGVYPDRHGIPSTSWFNRMDGRVISLTSFFQREVIDFLHRTNTDTIFDYARRSDKSTMAVATQVAKGVNREDWIKISIHLWATAFWINFLSEGNTIPDGAHIDRGITKGLLHGQKYLPNDGLNEKFKIYGNIPDLTVVHYIGLDIFTHYPRAFMLKEEWTVQEIQEWYLKEVIDPEIGKIISFLREKGVLENTLFFFVSDHGQTKIKEQISEKPIETLLSQTFEVNHSHYLTGKPEIIVMPGAGTKDIYVKNRKKTDWISPPSLIQDIKPAIDILIDIPKTDEYLSHVLIGQYPGERSEGVDERDAFWHFDLLKYRKTTRRNGDFLQALECLTNLDIKSSEELRTSCMYRRIYSRENKPDIVLINKPGFYFAPDKNKFTHHGSIHRDDVSVSFLIAGPAANRLFDKIYVIRDQIETIDMTPIAAHLAGIKIDKAIDGKDRLLEVLRRK
jgi:hypothetical protein